MMFDHQQNSESARANKQQHAGAAHANEQTWRASGPTRNHTQAQRMHTTKLTERAGRHATTRRRRACKRQRLDSTRPDTQHHACAGNANQTTWESARAEKQQHEKAANASLNTWRARAPQQNSTPAQRMHTTKLEENQTSRQGRIRRGWEEVWGYHKP